MVFLPSVNVAIRVNPLYRTAARHIQTFVLWIAERGNWLSVRVAATPEYGLETQPERSSMNSVEWFNDQITWTAQKNGWTARLRCSSIVFYNRYSKALDHRALEQDICSIVQTPFRLIC